MTSRLPILPTSVVGSYAWPSWVWASLDARRRGELGETDIREVLDDAVDMALRDQEEAGIDLVTDGEMRRIGFFTAEFYQHVTGLRALEPDRRLGVGGHDQLHRFEVLEPIAAPLGLGVVAEYIYARTRTSRPLKVTLPGPFTLAGRLVIGRVYPSRAQAAEAFVPILNAELKSLVAAGATFIQIDEPSPAIHPSDPIDFAGLFNAAVDGVSSSEVRLAAHLCFGNYLGRPLARRTYASVLDQMLRFRVDQLVLEFANREMAELEICKTIANDRDVAVGVVDVKNYYLETADEVAARIRSALAFVPAEKLSATPDCGFSQTARWASRAKLNALVGGVRLVRSELGL
jgi:5-methyltetrahydropteroyltriglutamate--homocysteine methyltransferase